LLVRAAVAIILIAAPASQLPAQEVEGAAGDARQVAVLVSGPVRRQTLPFLPPNTIEYQRGVYELPAAPASEVPATAAAARGASVEVFYTEAPVFRRGTWTEASCDGRAVDALPEGSGRLVHFAWPQRERHAFFRFGAAAPGDPGAPSDPGASPAGSECDFIEAFLERFSFFLETTDSAGVAPFPAVVPR
jgi:hypothetical protein